MKEIVMMEMALAPPLAAVMLVMPNPIGCTRPRGVICATVVSALLHAMGRLYRYFPLLSCKLQVSCWVVPMTTMTDAGTTVAVATGPSASKA